LKKLLQPHHYLHLFLNHQLLQLQLHHHRLLDNLLDFQLHNYHHHHHYLVMDLLVEYFLFPLHHTGLDFLLKFQHHLRQNLQVNH
tara:strand:- start:71 stop:325 length:255 start_codon:yes stop_codon:yes gene_type:complete